MKILLAAVIALCIAAPVTLLLLSTHTVIQVSPPVHAIADATPIKSRLRNPHGFRRLAASVEQDGKRYSVFETTSPAHRFSFWHRRQPAREITITAGKKTAPALHQGKAKILIEAQSNDFRGATDSLSIDVDVITEPPRVTADGNQHYVNQGGSEFVVFTPSGYWTEAGVRVGNYSFRSFPHPAHPQQRFSLFAYPWDLPPDTAPVVFARNPAGAEATARFWFKLFPKKFRSRDLPIDDAFLEKVVNQIDPHGPGDVLTRFLQINGEMRRRNNQALSDLRLKTEERFTWSQPFLQLANSQVQSVFADKRSYIYKGRKIDEQVHLGFDLAVTRNVAIPAANDGKIVYAADLGIYGNCIVVDHGYGLQSIYGHLSEIAVKPGDRVKRGGTMGKSGSTGLAGGDHLHFSMQVDGVQINPVEWWDEHWIKDRVFSKLK